MINNSRPLQTREEIQERFENCGLIRVTRVKRETREGDNPVIYLRAGEIVYIYNNANKEKVLVLKSKFAITVEENMSELSVLMEQTV